MLSNQARVMFQEVQPWRWSPKQAHLIVRSTTFRHMPAVLMASL